MKKRLAVMLCAAAMVSLAACQSGSGGSGSNGGGQTSGEGLSGDAGNILIAYFSVPETDGVDTVAGASRVAVDGSVMGNNEYLANLIAQETGSDLFAIETTQEYPGTHDELLDFAYNEMQEDARPDKVTAGRTIREMTIQMQDPETEAMSWWHTSLTVEIRKLWPGRSRMPREEHLLKFRERKTIRMSTQKVKKS